MLAFGTSVIRLAGIARRSGRAGEAVSELWPLITRLEARVAAGYAEPQAMSLLARARMSLGVALGHLLPDEQLATAARWTGRALRIAWHLGDRPLLGPILRMHGNELRKAGHPAGAGRRPGRPAAGCPGVRHRACRPRSRSKYIGSLPNRGISRPGIQHINVRDRCPRRSETGVRHVHRHAAATG